eukprot:4171975-Ditylum_brightwellii.AAC.1
MPSLDPRSEPSSEPSSLLSAMPSSMPSTLNLIELRSEADLNMCFDLRRGRTRNGVVIQLLECNGTPSQHWLIDSEGYIRSALDYNKCVDLRGPSTGLGTQIQIWDCVDGYQFQQ